MGSYVLLIENADPKEVEQMMIFAADACDLQGRMKVWTYNSASLDDQIPTACQQAFAEEVR